MTYFDPEGINRPYDPVPKKVELPEKAVRLFDGKRSLGLVKGESGALYIWGWNMQGLLADGTTQVRMTPEKLEIPGEVVDISAYDTHVIALCDNAKVYTWGSNCFGALGYKLYQGETYGNVEKVEYQLTPREVPLCQTVVSVAAGRGASYALTQDGEVYTWGANDVGQLGTDGSEVYCRVEPARVDLPQKIVALHVGAFHVIAQAQDGTLYGWGHNGRGFGACLLGTHKEENIVYTPVEIIKFEGIKDVSVSSSATFVMTDAGEVYAWGSNLSGAIGGAYPDMVDEPTKVTFVTLG